MKPGKVRQHGGWITPFDKISNSTRFFAVKLQSSQEISLAVTYS
jgi:hypothetical protein